MAQEPLLSSSVPGARHFHEIQVTACTDVYLTTYPHGLVTIAVLGSGNGQNKES